VAVVETSEVTQEAAKACAVLTGEVKEISAEVTLVHSVEVKQPMENEVAEECAVVQVHTNKTHMVDMEEKNPSKTTPRLTTNTEKWPETTKLVREGRE
jgi:hypothetical protein